MKVSLIWRTDDAEKLIVRMARVSNPKNADNWETGPKLLRYLLKEKHVSPFEMADMCLEIETERDISAQIIRHSSFSFQEFSTRYAKTLKAECPEIRRQDTKNRQNSFDDFDELDKQDFRRRVTRVVAQAYAEYERLLEDGVAKECARRILPLCTPTTILMKGSLRSWLFYLALRTQPSTQLEHRRVAQSALEIFHREFPIIAEAFFGTNTSSDSHSPERIFTLDEELHAQIEAEVYDASGASSKPQVNQTATRGHSPILPHPN